MAHVIEGTWDEIKSHEAELAGHKLRVIVDPEPESLVMGIPTSPIVIRDKDHLVQLLLKGIKSPKYEVTALPFISC